MLKKGIFMYNQKKSEKKYICNQQSKCNNRQLAEEKPVKFVH